MNIEKIIWSEVYVHNQTFQYKQKYLQYHIDNMYLPNSGWLNLFKYLVYILVLQEQDTKSEIKF